MINILLDGLPQEVNGKKINSDFRISILFELLMQDRDISKEEKVKQALVLYYPKLEEIGDYKQALEDITWFYRTGKEKQENKENNEGEENQEDEESTQVKQIYSYEFDAEYIYSAFMEQYKIDLNSIKYLHWWKFKYLFNSLNENVLFSKIMSYRCMNVAKIKNKNMRKFYEKMQRLYKLPDMRSEEEKENDFANELW